MKYIFFLLFLVNFQAINAQTLNQSNYATIASKDTESMTARLSLDSTQIVRIDSANQKFYRRLVMLSYNLSKDERKDSVLQIEQEKESVLKAVLTVSQWHTYRQVIDEQRQRLKDKLQADKSQQKTN